MKIDKIVDLIKQEIGSGKVLTDKDILETYSRDETSDLCHHPDFVIRAASLSDVSRALKICYESDMPVTPRGAGTGVTGGSVPINGGAVLSMEKMNRILEIDTDNMTAVVEPGVITKEIQDRALEQGLMYPPDPASLDTCSIGGNVAEGAGGPRAVRYGTTKDYVLGLEFVLPNGDIINTGGKFVKNATGYNLIGMLIGSEGTLAVITKIYLKLIPAPGETMDLLIPFNSIREALDTVSKLISSKIVPTAIEFMEEDTVKLVKKFLKDEMPFPDAKAQLIVQIDGENEEEVLKQIEKINGLIKSDDAIIASTKNQKERLWKARRSIREAIQSESPVFLSEDTVVPRSEIPDFLTEVKDFLNGRNLRSVMFGHAGDGNVHIDVLKGDMPYEEWKEILPGIKEKIYRIALAYGGALTGEHGVGVIRSQYMPFALGKEQIELSKRIKAAFDPKNLLNPGKIFTE